jgi:hypothetical protein
MRFPSVCCAGETDDHRGERAADGQRARVEAGDTERHDDREPHKDEADEEPDGPRRPGVQAPEERRRERAPDIARDLPAQHDEHHRRGDLHRRLVGPAEEVVAIAIDDQDSDQHGHQHQGLDPRALDRAPAQLARKPGLAPRVTLRAEQPLDLFFLLLGHDPPSKDNPGPSARYHLSRCDGGHRSGAMQRRARNARERAVAAGRRRDAAWAPGRGLDSAWPRGRGRDSAWPRERGRHGLAAGTARHGLAARDRSGRPLRTATSAAARPVVVVVEMAIAPRGRRVSARNRRVVDRGGMRCVVAWLHRV